MAVGDIYEVKLYCKKDPQIAVNVLHYRVKAIVGAGVGGATVAEHMSVVFGPRLRALMPQSANFAGASAQHIWPPPHSQPFYGTGNSGIGDLASEILPLQTTGMITKTTGFGGRAYRGRFYVPFPPEIRNDADGSPTALYLGDLTLLGNEIKNTQTPTLGADNITLEPILKNKEFPGIIRFINGVVVRDKWAVQRRRGSYGQPNVLPF